MLKSLILLPLWSVVDVISVLLFLQCFTNFFGGARRSKAAGNTWAWIAAAKKCHLSINKNGVKIIFIT